MAYINVYQGAVTSNSVIIEIYGLDPNYTSKEFDVYLDRSFYRNYTATATSSTTILITGLQENTSYFCQVRAFCYKDNDWKPDPATAQNWATLTITTGSGGGSSATPRWSYTLSGSTLSITVYDADDYWISPYLQNLSTSSVAYDGQVSGRTWSKNFTLPITLPSNNDFRLWVDISTDQAGGSRQQIQSINNNSYEQFSTDGGGGGDDPIPSTGDGYVWIYHENRWRKAKPYIYFNGAWHPATPYIFNGTTWKKCTD